MTQDKFILFIRLSRPHFLLGGILLYALGAGIASYLGLLIDWGGYFLGQIWVTSLQLSTQYLNEYFDAPVDRLNPRRTLFSGGSGAIGPGRLARNTALIAAATTLTITASLTVLLIQNTTITPVLTLVLFLTFLGAVLYSTPPISLSTSGYGELTTSVIVANLVPSIAFLIQSNELHRLVAMSTFPLTVLHIAMMMVFEFPDYANDVKSNKTTLLVRLGWRNGMRLHAILILSAYILLGLGAIFGLPASITLSAMLSLPVAALHIWQMRRIAAGAKPNWNLFTFMAAALFALTAYLLAFAYWIR